MNTYVQYRNAIQEVANYIGKKQNKNLNVVHFGSENINIVDENREQYVEFYFWDKDLQNCVYVIIEESKGLEIEEVFHRIQIEFKKQNIHIFIKVRNAGHQGSWIPIGEKAEHIQTIIEDIKEDLIDGTGEKNGFVWKENVDHYRCAYELSFHVATGTILIYSDDNLFMQWQTKGECMMFFHAYKEEQRKTKEICDRLKDKRVNYEIVKKLTHTGPEYKVFVDKGKKWETYKRLQVEEMIECILEKKQKIEDEKQIRKHIRHHIFQKDKYACDFMGYLIMTGFEAQMNVHIEENKSTGYNINIKIKKQGKEENEHIFAENVAIANKLFGDFMERYEKENRLHVLYAKEEKSHLNKVSLAISGSNVIKVKFENGAEEYKEKIEQEAFDLYKESSKDNGCPVVTWDYGRLYGRKIVLPNFIVTMGEYEGALVVTKK